MKIETIVLTLIILILTVLVFVWQDPEKDMWIFIATLCVTIVSAGIIAFRRKTS